MRIHLDSDPIRVEKEENRYDRFVLDFLPLMPASLRYAVVSGYPAILFGRERHWSRSSSA